MPDIRASFNSFLKADDVKEGPRTLTIKSVIKEKVGPEDRREDKWVMRFVEDDRGMTLNKTRNEDAGNILGSFDTDSWVGKKITLAYDPNVKYQGKRVGGICFRPAT